MKKILVTGGAGFLGSHLCEKLINLDNYVMCLDNLYTGKKENLYSIKDNKNFKFINADVINKIDIKVDEIYNLACPASPIHYQSDPVKTITTNVQGSLNVLELANKYNAKLNKSKNHLKDHLIIPTSYGKKNNLRTIKTNSYHNFTLSSLSNKFDILMKSKDNKIESFLSKDKKNFRYKVESRKI